MVSFSPPSCIDGYIWTESRHRWRREFLAEILGRRHGRIADRLHVGTLKTASLALRGETGARLVVKPAAKASAQLDESRRFIAFLPVLMRGHF